MATIDPKEPTSPGDRIELSLTEEVRRKDGTSVWMKVGLGSDHRPWETSDEACDRIQDFVVSSLEAFKSEVL